MTLFERLSALEGPDREVDAAICVALQYGGGNSEGATNVRTDPDWEGDLLFEIGTEDCCNPIPELTGSVDAAIALVKRLRPGWTIANIGQDDGKLWHAELRKGHLTSYSTVSLGGAPTPAIALLIALLRSMEVENG